MAVDYHEYIKTEAWRVRAEAAKQRVGHRCQICNRPAARVTLDVHHRTYERLGNEQPEDLTVLCRGCHELYEKNRRIPSPPASQPPPSQPVPPAPVETASVQPGKQTAARNGVAPSRPFAPARINPQHTAPPMAEATAELQLLRETDQRYALDATAAASVKSHYELTAAQDPATTNPNAKAYHPHRRLQLGVALLIGVTLLLIAGLYDLVTLIPNAAQPLATPTQQAAMISTVAPTPAAAPTDATVAIDLPPLTITEAATAVQPTAAPTATPVPITPPTVAPTVAPPPQTLILRSGLVCSKPCSCAPVVRTITQGTPVTVLQTQLCGNDTWTQIGEAEWLGPGLVDQ